MLFVGQVMTSLHLHTKRDLGNPWLGSPFPATFLYHRRRTNFAKQLFLLYSIYLVTCRKTSVPGDYLNFPWSQHASQSPGSVGDAEFCIPTPPLNLGMAPCHPETFILKVRLLPSHHTMMTRYRIIAFKIPTWKREEWRYSSLWSITWKKSQ